MCVCFIDIGVLSPCEGAIYDIELPQNITRDTLNENMFTVEKKPFFKNVYILACSQKYEFVHFISE